MKHGDDDVVILSGARTPIGKFQGGLKDVPATELERSRSGPPSSARASIPPGLTKR